MDKVKVKLKLKDIKSSEVTLQKLAGVELSAKSAYRVSTLLRPISEELKLIEEQRMKLVKKYADKDNVSGEMKVENQKDDFLKEWLEFLETDIEIDIQTIDLSDLESIKFTPSEMTTIDKFVMDRIK